MKNCAVISFLIIIMLNTGCQDKGSETSPELEDNGTEFGFFLGEMTTPPGEDCYTSEPYLEIWVAGECLSPRVKLFSCYASVSNENYLFRELFFTSAYRGISGSIVEPEYTHLSGTMRYNGSLFTGNADVTVRVYDAAADGTVQCQYTSNVSFQAGAFMIQQPLGSGITQGLWSGATPCFITLEVSGYPESQPFLMNRPGRSGACGSYTFSDVTFLTPHANGAGEYRGIIGGYLTENGIPIDGNASIKITIYDSQTAGAALWIQYSNVTASAGIFSLRLDSNPLVFSENDVNTFWVGVTVNSQPEMERIPFNNLVTEITDGTYSISNIFAPCYLYISDTDNTTGIRNASLSGVLSAPDGSSLPDPVSVEFRLYDASTGGNLLWSETRNL